MATIQDHRAAVTSVAFSPDGQQLASTRRVGHRACLVDVDDPSLPFASASLGPWTCALPWGHVQYAATVHHNVDKRNCRPLYLPTSSCT